MSPARLSDEQWIEAITGSPLRVDGRDQLCVLTREQLDLYYLTFQGAPAGCHERILDSGEIEVRLLGVPPDEDWEDVEDIDPAEWL